MTTAPTGYRPNSQGHLIPNESIKPLDLLRDDTVVRIVEKARDTQHQLLRFKTSAMDDINSFVDIAAEQYSTKLGGKRGNLTLTSYDGRYRINVQVSDLLRFDERLHIAKQLIDECIHEWTTDSNANIKALIEHAFQTDKEGNINKGRVFGLMRLKIDDAKWIKAMEALKDSIQIASSSEYMRVYERIGQTDQYKQIALDIAGL